MEKRTGTGLGSRVWPVVLSLRGVLTARSLGNSERTARTSKREAKVGGSTIPGIAAKLLRVVFPLALCLSSLALAAAFPQSGRQQTSAQQPPAHPCLLYT